MCQYHRVLAALGDTHVINQCKHGTIHILWEHISIHVMPPDFTSMARTIMSMAKMLQRGEAQNAACVRLRIERVGLEFEPVDFLHLTCLVEQAIVRLDKLPAASMLITGDLLNEEFCPLAPQSLTEFAWN